MWHLWILAELEIEPETLWVEGSYTKHTFHKGNSFVKQWVRLGYLSTKLLNAIKKSTQSQDSKLHKLLATLPHLRKIRFQILHKLALQSFLVPVRYSHLALIWSSLPDGEILVLLNQLQGGIYFRPDVYCLWNLWAQVKRRMTNQN